MSDKVTVFFCTLCSKTWDQLPEGSVQLTSRKRGGRGHANTYRFADQTVHVIKRKTVPSTEEQQ